MFGLFKTTEPELPSEEDIEKLYAKATKEIKAKWIKFSKEMEVMEESPLSLKIFAFSGLIHKFVERKYPILAIDRKAFWAIVSIAIHESGTNSKESVNTALNTVFEEHLRGTLQIER